MALVQCKECGHSISKKAKKCPECGSPQRRTGIFTKVIAGFLILGLLISIFGDHSSPPAEPDKPCEVSDLQCYERKLDVSAKRLCRESIVNQAKYSHEWTDSALETKFSHLRWLDQGKVLTLIGDKIKLQNGFGAWQPHIYECDVDVATSSVLATRVRPGRI